MARQDTQSEPRTLPERVQRLETLIDERKEGAASQGSRLEKLYGELEVLKQFMVEEKAREAMAREAREEARWAALLAKLGGTAGLGGSLYALWQLLQGG
jgi:hypothetical protein